MTSGSCLRCVFAIVLYFGFPVVITWYNDRGRASLPSPRTIVYYLLNSTMKFEVFQLYITRYLTIILMIGSEESHTIENSNYSEIGQSPIHARRLKTFAGDYSPYKNVK